MNRSRFVAALASVALGCGTAIAEVKTWTGSAGNKRWNDPANWHPAGVPGAADDAVVPGDSGIILLPCITGDPAKISVKSLNLLDCSSSPLTELHPEPPCKGIEIVGRSSVTIGFGCIVQARDDSIAGGEGGNVVIRVTGTAASIRIGGKVIGGNGGDAGPGGVPPGAGGNVEVGGGNDTDRIVIDYDGELTGGTGGKNPGGRGGKGGDVKVEGKKVEQGGEVKGGAGGRGDSPESKGDSGDVRMRVGEELQFPPNPPRPEVLSGRNILIDIENGRILVHDLRAYGWVAKVTITISVKFGPPGGPGDIEFHNCDPDFMQAGVDICVYGRPILDPGVTLDGLCNPDAATPTSPCPHPFDTTGFESPAYAGSPQGMPLEGQNGFARPSGAIYAAGWLDYALENWTLPIQRMPANQGQCIAAVNPGGSALAGAEHAKTFTRERWKIEFDAAAAFVGASRPSSKIGSVSLEPLPGSAAFALQGRWTNPAAPNAWHLELVHFDAAGQGPITTPIPHPAFQNMQGGLWFGFSAEIDLYGGRIFSVSVARPGTQPVTWDCPPDTYLGGGANGAVLPAGVRFSTGGGQVQGSVFALDNVRIEPIREACYADCDPSSGVGLLDVFDFLCFQNRYAQADPYACDCDTQSGAGLCDVFDFLCFQNAYGAGCP